MSDQEAKDEDLDEILERGMVDGVSVRFVSAEEVQVYRDQLARAPENIPRRAMVLFAPVDEDLSSDISDLFEADGLIKPPWREWPRKPLTIETFSRAWDGIEADPIADLRNAQRDIGASNYRIPILPLPDSVKIWPKKIDPTEGAL